MHTTVCKPLLTFYLDHATIGLQTYVSETRTTQRTHTEVLIAGAGPAGLALAADLIRRGIDTMIIDRQAAGANTSRACVIHSRHPLANARGVRTARGNTGFDQPRRKGCDFPRTRSRPRADHDFASIPSAYRYTLMCPQDRTERILLDKLERLGGRVEWGSELTRSRRAPTMSR
jgi:2-polyprenyl-6-methoxyphenol hydroxylase-like FAD-dependent oxidoreductase